MAKERDAARMAWLAGETTRGGSAAGLNRAAFTGRMVVYTIVRNELTRSGIDPERATALCLGEVALAQVANVGRVDEFPRSYDQLVAKKDEAFASEFAKKIGDTGLQYQDGEEPDFRNASLAELFAWCLTRTAC